VENKDLFKDVCNVKVKENVLFVDQELSLLKTELAKDVINLVKIVSELLPINV
jgi:hypothetical protein